MLEQDPDATIKARPHGGIRPKSLSEPHTKASAITTRVLIGGLSAFVILAGGAYLLFGPSSVAPSEEAAGLPGAVSPALESSAVTRLNFPHRSEAEILAQTVSVPTAAWFSSNPLILVVDYPDLKLQGSAFNRMAAFIEKARLPRDRVLNDQELAAAILGEGATPETYYYGHDYRISDVVRFFVAADRQKMALSLEEERLRRFLTGSGKFESTATGAIISIPREGSDTFVDASGRTSLLRHELSHGEYFTNRAFAEFCHHYWNKEMTEADRAGFRLFLVRQGYDATDEDLLINEMQAHLMNTTDPRYFNTRESGLSSARIKALRLQFIAGMPAGWLQDAVRANVAKLP